MGCIPLTHKTNNPVKEQLPRSVEIAIKVNVTDSSSYLDHRPRTRVRSVTSSPIWKHDVDGFSRSARDGIWEPSRVKPKYKYDPKSRLREVIHQTIYSSFKLSIIKTRFTLHTQYPHFQPSHNVLSHSDNCPGHCCHLCRHG